MFVTYQMLYHMHTICMKYAYHVHNICVLRMLNICEPFAYHMLYNMRNICVTYAYHWCTICVPYAVPFSYNMHHLVCHVSLVMCLFCRLESVKCLLTFATFHVECILCPGSCNNFGKCLSNISDSMPCVINPKCLIWYVNLIILGVYWTYLKYLPYLPWVTGSHWVCSE